jgi:hypothetical protein
MDSQSKTNIPRLTAVVLFSALASIALFFLARNPGRLPIFWLKVAAAVGIVEFILVGWWAKRRSRLSWGLSLLLVGGLVCFTAGFLPISPGFMNVLVDVGVGLMVLSWLSRWVKLLLLAGKKKDSGI